jgi:competence protein ComEC
MRRAPLVHAVVAVALGMAWTLTRPVPSWSGPFLLPAAFLGLALALVMVRPPQPAGRPGSPAARAPARGTIALLALWLGAGCLLGAATRVGFDRSCVHRIPDDGSVAVHGVVASAGGSQLRVRLETVRLPGGEISCVEELPARLREARWKGSGSTEEEPVTDAITVGSRFEAAARWWTPPGASPSALRRPGALLLDNVVLSDGGGPEPLAERLRGGARARVDRIFGAQSPLAASVLLAQRDALDRDVRDRFARAGLSHLLAISGLHVGLICGILLLAGSLLRLGRRWSAIFAAVGTVGYVVLLGSPHSAVRAALQLVLLLAATMLQRPTRPESLVATAALAILLMEPGALLSPGFQLSFAGVAGLLALRPPLLRRLERAGGGDRPGRAHRWLADALATSLAATLATAPVVAWHFAQVAPIGIAANLVAIPLLSVTLPALALALLAGAVSPAAGAFLAGPGALGLAALDRVAALAAAVPGGALDVHGSSALLLTGALAAGWTVSGRMGQVRGTIKASAWAAVAIAVLVGAGVRPPSDRVEIHVIDVGQGDAVALRTPSGRWLLVDAGLAARGFDAGERRVVPYLARRGVRRLEGVVLTHPHLDHFGGAGAVIQTLRPRWVGDPASPAPSAPYLEVLKRAESARIPWVGLRKGHHLALDGVTVEFLHPEATGAVEPDLNDLSVVMRVSYGEFAALLTGDATAAVEMRVLGDPGTDLGAHVLKLGHHGSHTSTTPALLAAASPSLAIVSAGQGNRYGHPHRSVLERLEAYDVRVLRTDRHGSIVIRADAHGDVQIRTERAVDG